MKALPWSDSEIDAGITLYLSMKVLADNRKKYNKAAMIRKARGEFLERINYNSDESYGGKLANRSKGSIEMKLMNICAAVEALGRKDLSMAENGFRPMVNMQKKLMDAVAARISSITTGVQHENRRMA